MKPQIFTAFVMSVFMSFMIAPTAFSADAKKAEPKAPSKEMRQKMAEVHSKMATCLKSDKPMSECKGEMMKTCQEMMGQEGCPMMGQMGGHMGDMMGQGSMMGGDGK